MTDLQNAAATGKVVGGDTVAPHGPGQGSRRRGCGSCLLGGIRAGMILFIILVGGILLLWAPDAVREQFVHRARANAAKLEDEAARAFEAGDAALRSWIERKRMNPNAFELGRDGYRRTLLSLAAERGTCVRALLDLGADPNLGFQGLDRSWLMWLAKSESPLETAIIHGRFEAARQLLACGADHSPDGRNPLVLLARQDTSIEGIQSKESEIDWAQTLLDAGVAVNSADEGNGMTPLMAAAERNNAGLCLWLLRNGANWWTTNANGRTASDFCGYNPICFLSVETNIAIVAPVLAGAPLDSCKSGCTPILTAMRSGNVPLVACLVERGAQLHGTNAAALSDGDGRWSMLHWLIIQAEDRPCRPEEVSILNTVLARCPIDVRGSGGLTPLMAAAASENIEYVRELLKRGADPTLKSEAGKTAYEIAESETLGLAGATEGFLGMFGSAAILGALGGDEASGKFLEMLNEMRRKRESRPILVLLRQAEKDWARRPRDHGGR